MFPDEMAAIACKIVFFIFAVCAMCMSRVYSADLDTTLEKSPKSPIATVRIL